MLEYWMTVYVGMGALALVSILVYLVVYALNKGKE